MLIVEKLKKWREHGLKDVSTVSWRWLEASEDLRDWENKISELSRV